MKYGTVLDVDRGWEPDTLNVNVTRYNGDEKETCGAIVRGYMRPFTGDPFVIYDEPSKLNWSE